MLSIHPDIRNWVGERFVSARIRHQERLERWFPAKPNAACCKPGERPAEHVSALALQAAKKEWAHKLTKTAKDDLFNMFHNKSDDFLDEVACGRIKIIGPAVDASLQSYRRFDCSDIIEVNPERLLPAIGYRSTLDAITKGSVCLADFYQGCCHQHYRDLFLVGFARPIIGNIPTISEMQALYVCGSISGRYQRPEGIVELNRADQQANRRRFCKLNLDAVYPVEMFSYCDRLAGWMNMYPSCWQLKSLIDWWRLQLTPATTMHYWFADPQARAFFTRAPRYMPIPLVGLLLLLKPIDAGYRFVQRIRSWIS